jgi:uncharacterized protein
MLQRFSIADLSATPWKNGGGSTREIVCRPEGADVDGFDWRVSIATIDQAGPFSAFPGVDRVIMLLEGDGVHLRSSSGLDHRLVQAHVPFSFSGDVALDCTLLGGTSTDFNVMTRRGAVRADVRVLQAAEDIAVADRGLLLVVRGEWQMQAGVTTEVCAAGQGLWWDAVPHGCHVTPQGQEAALVWVRLDTVGA